LKDISNTEFFKKYIESYPYNEKAEISRGFNKANSIYDSFLKYEFETNSKHNIKSIMDIACGEGFILDSLKNLFGIVIKEEMGGHYNCLGLEIDMDYVTNEMKKPPKFKYIKYYSLPSCIFPNLLSEQDIIYNNDVNRKRSEIKRERKYDLITIILGLHHFDNFGIVLEQVYKSLENGGVLLIRDHNVINCLDLMLVELEHLIPDFQRGAKGESNGCYLSSYSQDLLLEKYGFKLVYSNFLTEDRFDTIERNIHTTNINDRFYKKK
jgi:SAM-dependent methyltransferase